VVSAFPLPVRISRVVQTVCATIEKAGVPYFGCTCAADSKNTLSRAMAK